MHQLLATAVLATSLLSSLAAHAAGDTTAAIDALNTRLTKIGAVKLEGTDRVGERTVPAIFFGARKINNNYDVVDEIKKTLGATATVFVRDGEEFVRVSTNVLTPEGKRGVGTQLARNKAYESVVRGQRFCGVVDILGAPYDTCYDPLKDGSGKVIGLTYVGFKKS